MLVGLMKRIRRLQPVHKARGQRGIRHTQVEASIFVQDVDMLDVIGAAEPLGFHSSGFEPQEVLPHTMGLHGSAVVEEDVSAQPKRPGFQVGARFIVLSHVSRDSSCLVKAR